MGERNLEEIAFEALIEQGYDVRPIQVALDMGPISDGSREIVRDTLACALMGVRRTVDLHLEPDPDTQGQLNALADNLLIAQAAAVPGVYWV